MARRKAGTVEEEPLEEVSEELADLARPGIKWWRDWYFDDDPEPCDPAWRGQITVWCDPCGRPYVWLGQRWFHDRAGEAAAWAELEARVDAHVREQHPQLSLFNGWEQQ